MRLHIRYHKNDTKSHDILMIRETWHNTWWLVAKKIPSYLELPQNTSNWKSQNNTLQKKKKH